MRRPALAARALAAAFALACGGEAAAQVLINPVVVELGARQRSASVMVTLSEQAPAPIRLQAEVLRWAQDVQGGDLTEPSDELLVSPPIADLRPGERQLFRVALRGARAGAGELAYRLLLEEVGAPPAAPGAAPGMAIKFRMRYDLPVLVSAAGPTQDALRWHACPVTTPTPAAEACVRLRNAGNHRVKVQSLVLAGDGWQQELALKTGAGVTILAGAEREWYIPLKAGQTGAPRGLQVRSAAGDTLQAEAGAD